MSAKWLTLLVGVFALWVPPARADIHPPMVPAVLVVPAGQPAGVSVGAFASGEVAPVFGDVGSAFDEAYGDDVHHSVPPGAPRWNPDDVRKLPAAPGSASLFLSAVLSVGAWNLVRSAKQFQFNVPEWYHTGAPDKIGSAVAFDLVFNELLPCVFEHVLSDPPSLRPTCRVTQRRFEPRVRVFVADADPRGPPLGV